MPRQDYGWTISSQRGGPGGCPFDDCQHLERATGRCADEWVLCEVEFFWWAAIGGMRTTYRNVIDGTTVQCPQRGVIGADSPQTKRLTLGVNEWITGALTRVGDSRFQAGGSCVDRLKLLTQCGATLSGGTDFEVRGTSATGPCQTAVFTGSLKVTVPTGARHRTREPITRVIEAPASLRSSRSCTRDLCQRSKEQLRVSALEPQGQGVIAGGQVVRAVAGRAGDSLDAISFVLGPPIPEMWTPKTHACFPRRTRRAIYTVLLASMCRADCFWAKLDQDTLHYIFGLM